MVRPGCSGDVVDVLVFGQDRRLRPHTEPDLSLGRDHVDVYEAQRLPVGLVTVAFSNR